MSNPGLRTAASSVVPPAAWRRHGLVVLCGAGLSKAPPASVPSWWDFNQGVLDGVREHYLAEATVPTRAERPLARLSLDRLDITEFSQIVHSAFAGVTWFELLAVLDGREPNANHRALAELARSRILRAVLTTNFDTLTERAMEAAAQPVTVFNTLVSSPAE